MHDPFFEMKIERRNGAPRIVLRGQLDTANADGLAAVIEPWLDDRPDVRSITFDASELDFVDGSGIQAIYGLTAPPRDLEITLLRPTHAVRGALSLTGLAPPGAVFSDDVVIRRLDGRENYSSRMWPG